VKRDMEVVRKLLMFFEGKETPEAVEPASIAVPGFDKAEVHYHVLLMCEAGLLVHERIESSTTPSRLVDALPFTLSWAGHEFLDAARDEGLWRQALNHIRSAGISVGIGLLEGVLISLAKQRLGLA